MMAGVGAEMTEVAADEHGVPGASGTGATGRRGRRVLIGLSFALIVPILLIGYPENPVGSLVTRIVLARSS